VLIWGIFAINFTSRSRVFGEPLFPPIINSITNLSCIKQKSQIKKKTEISIGSFSIAHSFYWKSFVRSYKDLFMLLYYGDQLLNQSLAEHSHALSQKKRNFVDIMSLNF
jgi:hypothetical protein